MSSSKVLQEQNVGSDKVAIRDLAESAKRSDEIAGEVTKKKKASRPNLWKIAREAMGKDLTRLSLPVYFNEPLSFVQRVMEDIEYSDLLDRASETDLFQTADRAALVASFVVSHYAATEKRTYKPFNPLLGETFDLVRHHPPVMALAEQVSHHPPVTAMYARGERWTYHTSYEIQSRFHGNTLEVWPEGRVCIRFDDGELFQYKQAHTYVGNIVMGTSLSVDNGGDVDIRENSGKFRVSLKFEKGGRKHSGGVVGSVYDCGNGTILKSISGNWWDSVLVDGVTIWTAAKRPERGDTGGLFDMTSFAWTLNAPLKLPAQRGAIPKTDSRLRPDVRALEEGDYKLAASEKDRLERAQRKRRKDEESSNNPTTQAFPKWFSQVQIGDSSDRVEWHYRGGYFDTKMSAESSQNAESWKNNEGPDIF